MTCSQSYHLIGDVWRSRVKCPNHAKVLPRINVGSEQTSIHRSLEAVYHMGAAEALDAFGRVAR